MAGFATYSEKTLPAPAGLLMKNEEALSEREILERVKRGRKSAYQVIVTRYMKKAYFTALGFVHNHQDALDISQEGSSRLSAGSGRSTPGAPSSPGSMRFSKTSALTTSGAKNRRTRSRSTASASCRPTRKTER